MVKRWWIWSLGGEGEVEPTAVPILTYVATNIRQLHGDPKMRGLVKRAIFSNTHDVAHH